MERYAVVTPDGIVMYVVETTRNAGDPTLQAEMTALTHGDNRWVWVDDTDSQPVQVGDRVDVDDEGCAEVVEHGVFSPRRVAQQYFGHGR